MKTVLRTWGLAFLAAALMTGCGSDNATGGGGSGSSNSDLLTGSSSSNTKSWSEFKKEVAEGRFRGSNRGDFVWQSVFHSSTNNTNCKTKWSGFLTYCSYSGSTGGSNTGSLSTRSVESDGAVYRVAFPEDATFGNSLNSIRNNLVSKMNSATDIRKCVMPQGYHSIYYFGYQELCYFIDGRNVGGTDHSIYATVLRNEPSKRYIFNSGNMTYLVDTDKPLAANPIGVSKDDGTGMKVYFGQY